MKGQYMNSSLIQKDSTEKSFVTYLRNLKYDDIPPNAIETVKLILLADIGTTIAGAREEGCGELRQMYLNRGGKPEATVLVFGDKLPVSHAALVNGVMSRALDFCDAMAPGLHMGSSLVPAALAAAELRDGCDGKSFLSALVAGAEIGARLNLTEDAYDGFDPTGVAGVFASTTAAAHILRLNEDQFANALALAFNKCGGSFQSNIDGSLAVRLIQGWVAETGVECALLAKNGLTGPANFLSGIYGYLHLFAKDKISGQNLLSGLGDTFLLQKTVFKKYPSCGLTQGVTELALRMIAKFDLEPGMITSIEIRLPPYAYRLVGHKFDIGHNARVNAQFSVQFCVANAIHRKASTLSHFTEEEIRSPGLTDLMNKIFIVSDEALNDRGHTAVDLFIKLTNGKELLDKLDIAPGFPGCELTYQEHLSRFEQCMDYTKILLPDSQKKKLLAMLESVESLADIRNIIGLTIP
jgi:2-methylcitrate dehydratase PrpD